MEIYNVDLTALDRKKLLRLLTHADSIGMDISGNGVGDFEENGSEDVFLKLYAYDFYLYIPFCRSKIMAKWVRGTGQEHCINAEDKTLSELKDWAEDMQTNADEKESNK